MEIWDDASTLYGSFNVKSVSKVCGLCNLRKLQIFLQPGHKAWYTGIRILNLH